MLVPIFLCFIIVLFFIIRGIWLVFFTNRITKGLQFLAIGLLPPVTLCTVAMLFFPACTEHYSGLSEWVTLKGKVVNAEGSSVAGAVITLLPLFTERGDYGENCNRLTRETITDVNGIYELTEVRPLSVEMTACYLVSPRAAVRSPPFFYGEFRSSLDAECSMPPMRLPLISENRLKLARRSINFLGWPRRKEKFVWLPRSEGDVIFLPDMVVVDAKTTDNSRRALEKNLNETRKTSICFDGSGYWDDKGIYRPYP